MFLSLSQRHITTAQCLTYLGTVPFILCVLAQYLKFELVDPLTVVRFYAAVITAFISGSHWALFLSFSNRCHGNLLISSNVITLFAWAALLMPDPKNALVIFSLCLLYLLVLDYRLKQAQVIPTWYYVLRHNATAIVVFCLVMLEFA